jgi:hypothetical protein
MANTRRNRKNRASRKNRNSRNSRRNNMNFMGGRRGLFSTLWTPIDHAGAAVDDAAGVAFKVPRNFVHTGISGVRKIGRSVTGHANAAIGNLVSRKRRGSRKNRRN